MVLLLPEPGPVRVLAAVHFLFVQGEDSDPVDHCFFHGTCVQRDKCLPLCGELWRHGHHLEF